MSIMTWKLCGPMRLGDWKSSAVLLTAALLLSSGPSARAFDINAGVSKESGPFDLFKFGFNAYKKGQKEEAVEAYRYAAEKGHTGSRWALANMYAAGDGVVENDFEAFKIYAEIANQGVEPGSPTRVSSPGRRIPASSSTRFCRSPATIARAFPTVP
jgi:uncharacterized protein